MNTVVALKCVLVFLIMLPVLVAAQQAPNLSSLERFDPSITMTSLSTFDIRDIRIGDNARVQASRLSELGGELQHVSGGNRSGDVEFIFKQPYKDSELVQNLELQFDKDIGFIHQIELTYRIASRYVDILPIYQKTVEQAAVKYGSPLSFDQVQALSGGQNDKPRLSAFLKNMQINQDVAEDVLAFFEDKQITPRTHFVETDNGRALLLSGFRQCYFWQKSDFAEILSLCSFQPSSGNMKGQGVTLSLVNFEVSNAIEHFRQNQSEVDINF
ncbi:hypothetical protein [Aliiglaciecola sp. M165]|uniref:hypothetical protein n=1 Tax=Aliiglaciecola sp. M165 TaxID=2593649 RepID=UPI00117E80E4|nr:hypothetical protein [Aliiglaciecola sp. M165]TRY29417.1 hypothetical protein FM019_18655 [Aliiglaciecola sp. M165]